MESRTSGLCQPEWADQIIFDYRVCEMPVAVRVICDYAIKLSLTPGAMNQDDIERLKQYDWTEKQITICTQIISYFNYINRIADGLGVEPEDWMTVPKNDWLAESSDWSEN